MSYAINWELQKRLDLGDTKLTNNTLPTSFLQDNVHHWAILWGPQEGGKKKKKREEAFWTSI